MNQWMPGWPGSLSYGGGSGGASMPALPALPHHPGGPAAAASSPLEGLAAYGVPISIGPGGHPVIRAGAGGTPGIGMPPEIPGMPRIPTPPPGFLGGPESPGLFRYVPPVYPFNPSNQTQQQGRQFDPVSSPSLS